MNLKKQLLGADGLPATQTIAKGYNEDGTPSGLETIGITVKHVLTTSLNYTDPQSKETPSAESVYKKGKQSYELNMGVIPSEFSTVEGVAEIKETMAKARIFNPVILYQVANELETYLAEQTKSAK